MAGGTLEIIINPEDWRALQRLLTPPEHLYAEPWRNGMSELATKGGLAAQRGAPAETGKLQGSIRAMVPQRRVAASVVTRVSERAQGYP